ncbi:MAG: hypothetical protein P9X24_11940 [Candidatus Hatepunaea meridiana]|nr:hypothetical protein [Candidatus Hatepunaea meridiana]
MKQFKFSFLVLLMPLMLANASAWQDSIVVMFDRTKNQYTQRWAFRTISELTPAFVRPFANTTIKDDFNTTDVKAAFVRFVESITINKPDPYPPDFVPCAYLDTPGDDRDIEGMIELPYILSLCVSWNIGGNLYTIADSLYIGYNHLFPVYCFIWNQMDTSYFNHVLTRTQTDSTFVNGVGIAEAYLLYGEDPKKEMKKIALDILETGAFSPYYEIRRWTAYRIVKVYTAGYTSLFSSVNTLLHDSRQPIRYEINYEISKQQRRNNALMEFNLGSDE